MEVDPKKLEQLAAKVKNDTATEAEKIAFFKTLNELLRELNSLIKEA